jgi:galactose mutarotase-like enzyme
MSAKKFVLIDQANQLHVPSLDLGPADVGGKARGYTVRKRVLQGGLSSGVDSLEVDNGRFRFTVLPTRGMGIWKAWLGNLEIGWRSPVRGPAHPNLVPVAEPSGLGWLDGFDELLVRCGLESNGAPDFDAQGKLQYPLHGRIANLPAHYLETTIDGESGEIRVTGLVDETRFLIRNLSLRSSIITRVGEPGISIEDEVTNSAATPAEFQLLYHINVGQPFLGPDSRLVAPVRTIAPRDARAAEGIGAWDTYAAPEAGFAEQAYFFELFADARGQTQTLLKSASGATGLSLRHSIRQLPYFVLWKNTAASADGYVTGLEPATNLPNPRSFEAAQGRVVRLAPGETARFSLQFEALEGVDQVSAVEASIENMGAGATGQIYQRPKRGWSPSA